MNVLAQPAPVDLSTNQVLGLLILVLVTAVVLLAAGIVKGWWK